MKSFSQYILSEKFLDMATSQRIIGGKISIYQNPTRTEVQEAFAENLESDTRYQDIVRLWIGDDGAGDVYMWSAAVNHGSVYRKVKKHLNKGVGDNLPCYITDGSLGVGFSYWSLEAGKTYGNSIEYSVKESRAMIDELWEKNILKNRNVKRMMKSGFVVQKRNMDI